MRLIIILLLVFITAPSFAQVGEVEVREKFTVVGQAGRIVPVLQYRETDDGRFYMLSYQNAEYTITDIKSLAWIGDEKDLEYIYNFFKEGFGNKEDRSLKVGDDTIKTFPSMKNIMVSVNHENDTDGRFYLSKKSLDKLFGKRK